jgi:O-antigen/teichoic acid export membrane protein
MVVQGTIWSSGGFGASQALRLANNLIITRLLRPEAFGLMAIVDSLLIGFRMVSDTGVGAALTHRSDLPGRDLLDTAWSVHAVRGLMLYVVLGLLAVPLGLWYDKPVLMALLPVAGLQLLLEGFESTGVLMAARLMQLRRLVVFELVSQGLGIVCMIVLAWFWGSVWALVWGGVATSVVSLVASHIMFPQRGARFRWIREHVRELVAFGRWLMPSTFLLFVIMRSDRLLLGKWLTAADLGAYNIACFLPVTAIGAVGQVSHSVLFPLFARLRDGDASVFRTEISRKRLIFLALTLPLLCAAAVFGDWLVAALYDARYAEAGWMVRVLACGAIVACANENALPLLLALGDPYRRFVALVCSSIFFIGSILAGGAIGGRVGLVAGVAVAPLLAYPMVSWALNKHGAWTRRIDLTAFLAAAAAISLMMWLRGLLT